MNRYLSELPQLFWVFCQFQQLGVKGRRGSVFSGDCETDGCHVLFPQIQNGEQKAYVLKNKQLTGPTKGVIYLEIDVIFNAVSLNFGFFVLLKSSVSWKLLFLICREFLSFLVFSKPWYILAIALLPPPGTSAPCVRAGHRRCGRRCSGPAALPALRRANACMRNCQHLYFMSTGAKTLKTIEMIANWTAWIACKHLYSINP